MAYTFTPNEVVCPKCDTQFTSNRVNGLALVEVATSIESRKRMHCRLTLNNLEREFKGQLPPAVKKAVLDGYNDLSRDVLTILGFGNEAE